MTQNDHVFESNKEILARVFSYTISLIESNVLFSEMNEYIFNDIFILKYF